MRYGSLGQNSGTVVSDERAGGAAPGVTTKEIPYDYVATFKLIGTRGKRQQDVISISTEGTFVAVSIGYSFVPGENVVKTPAPIPPPLNVPFDALFTTDANKAFKSFAEGVLLRFGGIQFLYTIVDSGTGRELQNKALDNISGLGSADGNRPFRPFARPVLYPPRATIRIEIEEISEGPLFAGGTLYLVLHGYKRLGE